MAITYSPEEYIAALGDLTPLVNEVGGLQGIDILNQYARPGSAYNIPNGGLGGFSPATDPNYSSGQNYARSIAGGMPMSQIMSPGVSYSPENPTGYTQQQLNLARDVDIPPPPPAIMPPTREPDDMSVLGTGIGGYRMPYDRKQQLPPVEKLFGNIPSAPAQAPGLDFGNIDIDAIRQQIADSGIDFTNLFGLPSQQQDLSQFVTKEDLPAMIPQVPNGSDFSIENLNLPDFSNFVTQQDLPVYDQPDLSQFITQQDLPVFNPKDYRDDFLSIAREGIEMPSYQAPDLSGFMTQEDINKAISGINIPSYQAPDLSGYDTRLADLEKTLMSLQQPVANDRFSVNQLNPRGLF